ncbi:MAG: 2-phospho-L-lactate transferase [Hyphomonadaceae bacterium]|nr:2-phospho-L-lactate transferase [Hyphomonadaceae bacterium]
MKSIDRASYVALSGGIGGAKLSLGLAHLLGERLSLIVNTGDDFEHVGLYVSPDIDTMLYTLGGVVNTETGWGRRDETWSFMQALGELGGPTWFNLGDRDLATHAERTRRLTAGETLTGITAHLASRLGIAARVLPMADAPVRTLIDSDAGVLAFQEYFVRDRCRPAVRAIRHDGAPAACLSPQVRKALAAPDLAGIIICPSNPWLSIDPILAVPGLSAALRAAGAPIIAVTPIVGGAALKGPTAKIMGELGLTPEALSIAEHYADLIDGFVLDIEDAAAAGAIPTRTTLAQTVMQTFDDKVALARHCLAACASIARQRRAGAPPPRAKVRP